MASENTARSLRGELYHAFTPELVKARLRCAKLSTKLNNAEYDTRRHQVEIWRQIVGDPRPLPPKREGSTDDEDDLLFDLDPIVVPPFRTDYGTNVRVGAGSFVNFNCTIIDTCVVSIGERVLIAPNVSFYSGSHPTDPDLRNGIRGPEHGKEIVVGDDCWIGGSVTVLPGVHIGRGCTIGAGSVVTKDIPEYSIAVGSPARVIKAAPRNTLSAEERQRLLDIANS